MTLHTLKHRNIAEIHRMLKRLVCLVAEFTLVFIGEPAKVNRMLKGPGSGICFHRPGGVVENLMTNVAIVADDFAAIAHVLAVMTTETTGGIEMSDVVRMRLPVCFHLGEEVCFKDALNLFNARLHRVILIGIEIGVVGPIELIQTG